MPIIRVCCLIGGLLGGIIAYRLSPLSQSFPFGNYLSLAFAFASSLALWASARLEIAKDRKLILSAVNAGILLGGVATFVGWAWGAFFGQGNLYPLLGPFVFGPLGFCIGAIVGLTARMICVKRKT
jgi:hypothetical protein